MSHAVPDEPRPRAADPFPSTPASSATLAGPIAGAHPPVALRAEAEVDETVLRLRENAAIKHNTFATRPGYARGGAHWQTHLHATAWVRNDAFEKRLWADVHVFAHDGALVAQSTLPFTFARPAGDGGDVFQLEHAVYEGATATPGSVTLRPDVRLVQFRLYAEVAGRVYTDGALHHGVLRADVATP